ncbi:MAG: 16S rRNA (cytosine(1402)-N(4))-methyltransferase RsmH [Betaproteobacteria bacterium]|nr:16S rRNA (cytosine(1402)-N(4))-methyltransferase RsmH [Betaproteobacteria bacterium]MDE2123619.1 16S rRNA (cytosine(1402)-N(4))-methyltransferase RsmH [Betaproteobacteria bacterium]MDE2186171.1 16S rRNA (cytosine(1402)-N(4))-methyltransferase RsmH [Betaproteobacteria bacterium]MDE2326064.1 16S rRNA (cytosine(1402)-N(4))-methyltransferase RsmH [Betaproteobacteria bacterium]
MPNTAPAAAAPLQHRTVLLHEAVELLVTDPAGIYLDATFGRGGHTQELLARLGPQARVVALDRDPQAIAAGQDLARADARLTLVHAAFSELGAVLDGVNLPRVQGMLFDLGVSSPQLDEIRRGFSFRGDAPLDMRMDTTRGITAAQFLAQASVDDITRVLRDYGDERAAFPIAKAVVARRERGEPVTRTAELAGLVAQAVRSREPGQDPATRTFQALRIHVNAELAELEAALAQVMARLADGGRLVVISFHSLEDRVVKQFIARQSRAPEQTREQLRLPVAPVTFHPGLKLLTKQRPGAAEVKANPRSRSAMLRAAERLPRLAAAAEAPEVGA